MEIYYWKELIFVLGRKPSRKEFEDCYAKLPIDFPEMKSKSKRKMLEEIFYILNDEGKEENPLDEQQDWIMENLQPNPHTSMSVGDIIKLDDEYWICKGMGWEQLWCDEDE